MRTHYAHLADVIRKYNPQLDVDAVEDNDYINSADDPEKIVSRIEEVESQFESLTRNPFRLVRRGQPGRPETFEAHEADLYRHQAGVKVWLDNRNIEPLDPDEGDKLELRVGRSDWEDITNQEGSRWEADYTKGWIRIYARYRRNYYRPGLRDKFMRVTYRHGASGDNRNDAGQTELTSSVAEGDTQIDVENTRRIPGGDVIVFVGGTEYMRITSRTDTTFTVSRPRRGTNELSHSEGETVHYCPLDLRSAVASKAAVELLRYEDWVDELVEGGGYSTRDKMDDWTDEWETILNKYSSVRAV